MHRRHDWLMLIRLCSIRYGLTEHLPSENPNPLPQLRLRGLDLTSQGALAIHSPCLSSRWCLA